MSAAPLVSVVIPMYNGEPYVGEAIETVLAQDYSPVELIVVDDGSTDGGPDVVRGFPEVLLLSQPNRGVAAARNAGLAAARGELIALLDQDDLWEPRKLALQAERLAADSQLAYVSCRMRWFLEPGVRMPPWARPDWFTQDVPAYITSALLARRSAFEAIGGFETSFVQGSDTEWMLRARDAGLRSFDLGEALVRHRLHDSNASYDLGGARVEMARILKESIGRRRLSHD